jgi:PLP dependent protein
MTLRDQVVANWRKVQGRMAAACMRVGRDPKLVTLVAVTKYARIDWVRALIATGQTELGENRPQQLALRSTEIDAPVHWHLIGPLQRNKVRLILPIARVIHSVESWRLLEAIDRIAAELDVRPRLLLEVNMSGETAKHGFDPATLRAEWNRVTEFRHVAVEGLMTMAPYTSDPEVTRPIFSALRGLRDTLREQLPDSAALPHLSMGMSGDFEVAIEEGATLVRVGSALWEGLDELPVDTGG